MKQHKFSHRELLKADKDHKKAAVAAHLIYTNDKKTGITRFKKGKSFEYFFKGKSLIEKNQLGRIKKLAIPPSWSDAWICPSASGHIQATGFDLNHRKQYRYHADWNKLRNETKFHRLFEFEKVLPRLRKKIKKDISIKSLTEDKVLAAAINLMEQTYIRIGNNDYEKLYGSYGLTTLKDKHVTIKKDKIIFSFIGKKGIAHNINLRNKKLAAIVKQCRDIPGKELFQYYTEKGRSKSIDSGRVNNYIQNAAGNDFSAKDFRTWAGSLNAIQNFLSIGEVSSGSDAKKNIITMLDAVSTKLGNSRNICKKYYVHPGLIKLYEENKLIKYLDECRHQKAEVKGLTPGEQLLMKVLKKCI